MVMNMGEHCMHSQRTTVTAGEKKTLSFIVRLYTRAESEYTSYTSL